MFETLSYNLRFDFDFQKEAKSMLKTETSPLLTDDNANLSIEGGTLNPHTRAWSL